LDLRSVSHQQPYIRKEVDCFDLAALPAFQGRVTNNLIGNVEEVFRSPVAHDSK
jgi:hypothetical protein